MKKKHKPKDFKLPESRVIVAACEVDRGEGRKYIQLYTGGTTNPKTVRRFAVWMSKAADWMKS